MMRVRGNVCGNRRVTVHTKTVVVWPKLRAAINVHIVRMGMASGAGCAAFEKTLTLPQRKRFVRNLPRPPVRPVCWILRSRQAVLHYRREEVVVVRSCLEVISVDIAQRVALRADCRAPCCVQSGRVENGAP